VELYASWVPGLPSDRQALGVLRSNPWITGVESCNVPDESPPLNAAGLRLSMHNPAFGFRADLTRRGLAGRIESRKRLLQAIRASDASTVGFHLCHGVLFHIREVLAGAVPFRNRWADAEETIVANLVDLEALINGPLRDKKAILFETNYAPPVAAIDRLPDPGLRSELRALVRVSSPAFTAEILARTRKNRRIGFLFDVAHCLGAAHNLAAKASGRARLMDDFIALSRGRVFQVHLNRPSRVGRDGHNPFRKGDALSDEVLGYAKAILAANPVRTLTLEIEGGPSPLAHARCLARQATLVAETLRLTKSGQ